MMTTNVVKDYLIIQAEFSEEDFQRTNEEDFEHDVLEKRKKVNSFRFETTVNIIIINIMDVFEIRKNFYQSNQSYS
ncbi:hypothetical protein ACOSP6_10960 [Tenacibaculum sp. MEBiC06402]|uniref:hypothetical protein n=1 Tax=unclassified Tenacibaculum TaxID=2635139 RepID=UPI003B9A6F04